MQTILNGENAYKNIEQVLQKLNCKKYMLVCDSAFGFLGIKDYFEGIKIPCVKFTDFTVNPLYEDVCRGVELFKNENCDALVAVGGGSTIDVAKCIKLFCKMSEQQNYLKQEYTDTKVPLIALPTTAGTGSESTRYAVIYFEGQKQSVTHESIVPDYAVLEAEVLKTLPVYQKKCTMLDALCQGIESWWSVNSTDESRQYSKIAVEKIIKNYRSYIFDNDYNVLGEIMSASNYAGKAINITQTTAAHAMSYKLTSLYSLPHGHAVAVGLPHIWDYMINNPDGCIDPRGSRYLSNIFLDIATALGCDSAEGAVDFFKEMLFELEIAPPKADKAQLKLLVASVNPVRLKNNPVELNEDTLYKLYQNITK